MWCAISFAEKKKKKSWRRVIISRALFQMCACGDIHDTACSQQGAESVPTKRFSFWNDNANENKILKQPPWLWWKQRAFQRRCLFSIPRACTLRRATNTSVATPTYCSSSSSLLLPGEYCQAEINECGSFPCQHNGTCVDLLGHYACRCPAGTWTHHLWYVTSVSVMGSGVCTPFKLICGQCGMKCLAGGTPVVPVQPEVIRLCRYDTS